MSSTNTEVLTLYKHPKLYNGSRYKFYHDSRLYDEWLYETSEGSKRMQVNYKSISEPIEINQALQYSDEYTYGSITNEGKTYYFFVDNISTDAYRKTIIEYTIDWWSTNWKHINCTKAHLTRAPVKPEYMEQPYTPLNVTSKEEVLTKDFTIFATYIPSWTTTETVEYIENGEIKTATELSDKNSFISYVLLEGTTENIVKVSQGTWYQELGLPGADIKDCFIVPFFTLRDFMTGVDMSPVFIIQSEDIRDRDSQPYPWLRNGPLLKTFIKAYPCFSVDDSDVHSTETAFTGNEIIYNQVTGRYYEPVWRTVTYMSQEKHWWQFVEIDDPLTGLQAAQYYLY